MTQEEIMKAAQAMAEEAKAKHEASQATIQDIRERYPDVDFPNVYTRPAAYIDGDRIIPIDGKVAIVGEAKSEVWNAELKSMETIDIQPHYAFASEQYKIERHETALQFMREALVELSSEFLEEKPIIKPCIFDDGARMTVNVRFPGVKFEVTGSKWKDQLNPMVEMRNSYDTSWEMMFKFKAMQLVCSNGMMAMKTLQKIGQKHRQNLNTQKLADNMTTYMGRFSEQIGIWDKWADKKLSDAGVEDIFEALEMSGKRSDEIKALPLTGKGVTVNELMKGNDLNIWDMNSALTQFATHNIESEMVRIDLTQRTANVLQRTFERN